METKKPLIPQRALILLALFCMLGSFSVKAQQLKFTKVQMNLPATRTDIINITGSGVFYGVRAYVLNGGAAGVGWGYIYITIDGQKIPGTSPFRVRVDDQMGSWQYVNPFGDIQMPAADNFNFASQSIQFKNSLRIEYEPKHLDAVKVEVIYGE